MKHNEKEIKNIAKTILDSASRNYDYKIIKAIFNDADLIIRGRYKGKEKPTWLVVIDSTSVFGETSDFLTINDIDGEPLYLQTKHQVLELEKVGDAYVFKE